MNILYREAKWLILGHFQKWWNTIKWSSIQTTPGNIRQSLFNRAKLIITLFITKILVLLKIELLYKFYVISSLCLKGILTHPWCSFLNVPNTVRVLDFYIRRDGLLPDGSRISRGRRHPTRALFSEKLSPVGGGGGAPPPPDTLQCYRCALNPAWFILP